MDLMHNRTPADMLLKRAFPHGQLSRPFHQMMFTLPSDLKDILRGDFLSTLSEQFSDSAQDGHCDIASRSGVILLALCLHPIGSTVITTTRDALLRVGKDNLECFCRRRDCRRERAELAGIVRPFLALAVDSISVFGKEGDDNDGPSIELTVLEKLLNEFKIYIFPRHPISWVSSKLEPFVPPPSSSSLNSSENSLRRRTFRRRGVTPLGSEFIVTLAVLFSVLFILSTSLAFVNPEGRVVLRDPLNAQQSGIVLLGESVDVDVNEPAVTIRWSILGCGVDFLLPGSPDLHGSADCGAPSVPIDIFLDQSDAPVFSYDPGTVPTNQKTGQRVIIQTQIQFDVNLVLDVHNARLYPFDTYLASMSLRTTSSNSSMKDVPLPLTNIKIIKHMPSFIIASRDTDIWTSVEEETQPGKHLEIEIGRPAHARAYAMLVFGINWALCHVSFGVVFLSAVRGRRATWKETAKEVMATHAILFAIPQLRTVMPDAAGFDGVLIDTVGYFPQMTLAGTAVVVLLLITVKRELDDDVPGQMSFLGSRKETYHERLPSEMWKGKLWN